VFVLFWQTTICRWMHMLSRRKLLPKMEHRARNSTSESTADPRLEVTKVP
jgi:hypothetical protein